MVENRIKHFEFIQEIIKRLSNNSFLIKGWSLTLTVATLGFILKGEGVNWGWFVLIPTLIFWYLDAYYLSLEKSYRDLYNQLRLNPHQIEPFYLEASKFRVGKNRTFNVFISRTIFPIYLIQIIILGQEQRLFDFL